jgi:hypothetical protein
MTALCAAALVLGHVYPGDAAGSVAIAAGFVLAMLPAAAVFGLTGLTLRRQLDPQQFWRRGAMLLVLVGGLFAGVFVLLGEAAVIAQTKPATQMPPDSLACDQFTDPKCPVPLDPTAEIELPPEVIDVVVVEPALQFWSPLLSVFTFLALYFVMVLALGQWQWLRRLALDAGPVPAWDEGRMRILLALPFLLLLGIGMRLSDTAQIWLLPLYPLAAAGLAWRFGYWGAGVALAGIVPMLGQSGIAANTVFGAGIGMALTVLILCRMVAERGFLGRLLALDTITRAQYGVAALLGLPIIGFAVPDIAMRFEAAPGLVVWLALFIIGLSRVRLEQVMLFLAATGGAAFGLGMLLPAATDDGFYAGFRQHDLAEAIIVFGWSLAVLATARALRRRFIADLGPDAAAQDGQIMAALTRVFDNRLVLFGLTAWTTILLKLQVVSQTIDLELQGLLFAFALGIRLWDLDDRNGTYWGLMGIVVTAPLAVAIAVYLPLNSTLVLSFSGALVEPGMQPLGWQIFVMGYAVFGYAIARLTYGLRVPAVLEPGLWVPLPQRDSQEAPDVRRAA